MKDSPDTVHVNLPGSSTMLSDPSPTQRSLTAVLLKVWLVPLTLCIRLPWGPMPRSTEPRHFQGGDPEARVEQGVQEILMHIKA